MRNKATLTYCGYVQLPKDHPDYLKSYFDLGTIIKVHGGLTFSNFGKFGFDCFHYNDISPTLGSISKNSHYWKFEEVEEEIKKMVDQFEERQLKN